MRKTNETVKNVTYTDNTRVATVEKVVSRADDCEHIGNLYFRLSDVYRRIEVKDITKDEKTALENDLATLKGELTEYLEYLNGYDA